MKLTIITINLNNRDGLRRTMESVVGQTCQDFEYVVIDGGSTDGSPEVIMEHQNRLAYWCSEPDRGIYNAMNKGVAHATGDYCLFLNSGDYLYNKDVVKEVLPELDGRFDIVYGEIVLQQLVDGKNQYSHIKYNHDANSITFINGTIAHQSSFIRRSLLVQMPYDEQFKVAADRKFFMECYLEHNCSFHHISHVIAYFPVGGISNTHFYKEENDIINNNKFPKRLIEDIKFLDPELLHLWSQIPTSYRLRKLLLRMLRFVIDIYLSTPKHMAKKN